MNAFTKMIITKPRTNQTRNSAPVTDCLTRFTTLHFYDSTAVTKFMQFAWRGQQTDKQSVCMQSYV